MKIHLEQLQHQEDAINAILNVFPEQIFLENNASIYANPLLKNAGDENKFIDCKMETGTGKTYVYTRLMYELHQRLGLFKFIIVVPSLAIKEGTKNFINADYTRQHFAKFFRNIHLDLHTLNAGDFDAKKGRKQIPNHIIAYCDATRNEKNTIQCLLISDKGHLDKANTSLFKNDYDQMLFGYSSCPADAIKETQPIVIIDEPHRLKRDGKSYQNIMEKFAPQMILRFGATFPVTNINAGQNTIDYYQKFPVFDLGAVESFNNGLVKAVDVYFPNLDETTASKKYKITGLTNKKLTLKKGNKEYEIEAGELLPADFEGNLTYEGGNAKILSNDLELATGMDLIAGIFSNSYQEILLSQAINAHFEKEKENFFRSHNRPKIKTISLFFIDSIKSYREENGWLKKTFEKLLNQKLDVLLQEYKNKKGNREIEYEEFLKATKVNLAKNQQDVHAGYFAEDKGKGDEAIQAEIDDILSNKEKMLSFKDESGNWNTRRFLFSKWTLREGWDNPNVFTICKLRASGSETSKIQEVGRGLRLPVDEQGNRLSNEEFRLNYFIGWDEKNFAEKLVGEINSDAKIILNHETLTEEMIQAITSYRNINKEKLLETLDKKDIIKRNNDFKEGGYEKLLAEYPELLQTQLHQNKVRNNNQNKRQTIKLRVGNWEKIAGFWEQVSKRYMLKLERLKQNEMETLVDDVLKENIFSNNPISIIKESTAKGDDGNVKLNKGRMIADHQTNIGQLQYGEFIKKLHKRTFIPVHLIHKKISAKLSELPNDKIVTLLNEDSLNQFVRNFKDKFRETFATKYKYTSLDFTAETNIKKNGSFVEELKRGSVGNNDAPDIKDDERNLYEIPLSYDSEIEHDVLKVIPPDHVIVYGKLPRQSIKLPTYTGGTTTPDFVYAVHKKSSDQIELHLVVEIKSENPHTSDKIVTESQKKAFETIGGNIQWRMDISVAEFEKALKNLAGKAPHKNQRPERAME